VLGRPVGVAAVAEASARGAAMTALARLGVPVPDPPIVGRYEPRAGRHESHREAMRQQEQTMRWEEST
jgi:sugar (pentulose or hexulose) kinase